jgi:cbb3-type cytochrome oxidase subunit 3
MHYFLFKKTIITLKHKNMISTSEVFFFIILPIFLFFVSICILIIIYKKCIKSNRENEENSVLLRSVHHYTNQIDNERFTNFDNNSIRVEVGLADKVNHEKQ